MNLIQRIEDTTMQYGSDSRRAIGEFILQERSRLYRYSIQEIAERTYTSKSALVRFAQSLGFAGWRDFLKAFTEEQQYQETHYSDIDPNYPFAADSTDQDILRQMCSLQVESLYDTADQLDEALLARGVPILALTSAGDNYLRQHAACTLTISSRERLYSKISTFATETSILYLLNLLFSCYFARDYDANLQDKIRTSRLLEAGRVATAPDLQEKE